MRFNVQVSNIEKVNPTFSKCEIKVLYSGINRNDTYMSKSTIEEALPTIYNIPIVGEYDADDENFGGHGGELDFSGDEAKWKHTTMPYGTVAESSDVYWETVEEKDGQVNEYLCIDGAYLWTGRYPEAALLLEHQFNQSMEIDIQSGEFSRIDGKRCYEIKKFNFSALCILGINKESDPTGHVEPCFPSASISAYTLNNKKFKHEFKSMIKELNFALKGGNKVSLTATQLFEEASREVSNFGTFTDKYWGDEMKKYHVVDVDTENSQVVAYDHENNYIVGFEYSVDGDKVTVNQESAKRFKISYSPMESEVESNFSLMPIKEYSLKVKEQAEVAVKEEFQSKIDELETKYTTEYEALETEFKDISTKFNQKIKAEQEELIEGLFNQFSAELSDEEMKDIKANKDDSTYEQIQKELFYLVGQKKANFALENNDKKQHIHVSTKEPNGSGKPYDYMFNN